MGAFEISMMREQVLKFLWKSGITSAARKVFVKKGRLVVMFHGVSAEKRMDLPQDVQPYLSRKEFREILFWLKARFEFLTPDQFLRSDQCGVLLTFDDGFRNNRYNVAPILEEFQAPAVFFVSAQHVADPKDWLPATRKLAKRVWDDEDDVPLKLAEDFYDGMSKEDLAWCAAHPLITIGSHTVTHPFLTRYSDEELSLELEDSKRFLERAAGTPVDLFAYPTGDYDVRVARAVEQAGYRAAFVIDRKGCCDPRFEIPRIGLYESNLPYLNYKFSGLHRMPLKGKILR